MKIQTRDIAIYLLLFLQTASFAKDVKVTLDTSQQGVLVLNEEPGRLMISSNIGILTLHETILDQETYFRIGAEGYTPNYVPGTPELPVRNIMIEYPLNTIPSIQIISREENRVRPGDYGITTMLAPSQLSASKMAPGQEGSSQEGESIHKLKAAGTSEVVKFTPVGSSRGTGVGMLTLSPFTYDHESGLLTIVSNMVFEVTWPVQAESGYLKERNKRQSLFFNRVLQSRLHSANPETFPLSSDKPVKYVILSDTMFRQALEPLVTWKTRKGFEVIELYKGTGGVGLTREAFKDTLKTLYTSATEDDPAPLYLLIAGDIQHIPASQASGQLTDLYYAEYDGGGDYLPDLYYGRFSAADTTQMKILVSKTLQHEQYLFPDPDFLNTSVLIAGVDTSYAPKWGNGQINYEHQYYFNEEHGNEVHKFLYPASGGSRDSILTVISNGASMVNYTGHGFPDRWDNPRLHQSDIPLLQNTDKYPVMIGNGCRTGTFNAAECFAEALVRADGRGALAYIGCTNDSYWDEDYYWAVGVGLITANPLYEETTLGAFDRAFHDHGEEIGEWYPSLAQLMYAGNLAVVAGNIGRARYYWEIYHLFGDPSLIPFYSIPDPIQAQHAFTIQENMEQLQVRTEAFTYGALTADGFLHDAGYTDASGILDLNLPAGDYSSDTLKLVLTGQGLQPYIADISVLPDSVPFIEVLAFTQHDSLGNNNGKADWGETISFSFNLTNRGTKQSDSLELKLTCTDPAIEILDSLKKLAPVDSLAEVNTEDIVSFILKDSIENGYNIRIVLEIRQGIDTREHYLDIPVYSPQLQVEKFSVEDWIKGNGNGQLDPGEEASLKIRVKNNGGSESGSVLTVVANQSGYISFVDTAKTSDNLVPGEVSELEFSLTVDPGVSKGTWINLPVMVQAEPYNIYDTLNLAVGMVIEDFESGNLQKYPWENDTLRPWTVDTETIYEGEFSARSGDISDNQVSSLEISVTSTVDDTISFNLRVSSEPGYDYLRFYLDASQVATWSGLGAWTLYEYPVPAGEHTFRWTYTKDINQLRGEDAAWIDMVKFPEGSFSQNNVGLTEILRPLPGQSLPLNDSVQVKIKNYGSLAIDSLELACSVNDTLIWSDTLFTTLPAGGTSVFTFRQKLQLGTENNHTLKVFTELGTDGFRGNDTISRYFPREFSDASIMSFESPSKGTADFRDTLQVSVWIRNEGTLAVERLNLQLLLDGILLSEDSLSVHLEQHDSTLFTFKDSLNLFDPGTYRIGIIAVAEGDYNPVNDTLSKLIAVDTVRDAGISEISSPASNDTILSDSETVSASIYNHGNYMIAGLPLTVLIDSVIAVQETMSATLYPADSMTYIFQSPVDLSKYGYHDVAVCVLFPGDPHSENDTIKQRYFNWHPRFLSSEEIQTGTMSIYPNPAQGTFRIALDDLAAGDVFIDIFNILGKPVLKVYHQHHGGHFDIAVDLENHPEGLYFIKIRTNQLRYSGSLLMF